VKIDTKVAQLIRQKLYRPCNKTNIDITKGKEKNEFN
jgi:hypothetical protein